MSDAVENTVGSQGAGVGGQAKKRKVSKLGKALSNRSLWRGVVALVGFVIFWEICSQMKVWTGIEVPWIGKVPPPSEVMAAWSEVVWFAGYWTASSSLACWRCETGFMPSCCGLRATRGPRETRQSSRQRRPMPTSPAASARTVKR